MDPTSVVVQAHPQLSRSKRTWSFITRIQHLGWTGFQHRLPGRLSHRNSRPESHVDRPPWSRQRCRTSPTTTRRSGMYPSFFLLWRRGFTCIAGPRVGCPRLYRHPGDLTRITPRQSLHPRTRVPRRPIRWWTLTRSPSVLPTPTLNWNFHVLQRLQSRTRGSLGPKLRTQRASRDGHHGTTHPRPSSAHSLGSTLPQTPALAFHIRPCEPVRSQDRGRER